MIVPQWVIVCGYMAGQYHPDKIDICKDVVSIPGISMTYVLSKSLEKKPKVWVIFIRGICHLYRDKREELQDCSCNGALKCGGYCEDYQLDMQALETCECEKIAVYNLLRTGMVGRPAQVFTRYHEKDITCIRSHVYEEKNKLTKGLIGYNPNALSLLFRWCTALWQRHAGFK